MCECLCGLDCKRKETAKSRGQEDDGGAVGEARDGVLVQGKCSNIMQSVNISHAVCFLLAPS